MGRKQGNNNVHLKGTKFYIAANSDGTGIISIRPLRRFYEEDHQPCSFQDIDWVPHWVMDFSGEDLPKNGYNPIGEYMYIPRGFLTQLAGKEMSWDDEPIVLEYNDIRVNQQTKLFNNEEIQDFL